MADKVRPPLVMTYFRSGLYTRRSQLFAAIRILGIQPVQFHDSAIDGQDMEIDDTLQWKRRPGFSRFCSIQLGAGEIVNQFYSSRASNGNVNSFIDSNQRWATFTPTSITTLLTKTTTAQGFVQQIGNTSYFFDGPDAVKWNGSTVTNTGIAAPLRAITFNANASTRFWVANNSILPGNILDYNGNMEAPFFTGVQTGPTQPLWPTQFGAITSDSGFGWLNRGPLNQWLASTVYIAGQTILDSNGNLQVVVTGGTSGTAQPTWLKTGNTTDNTVTWGVNGPGNIVVQSGYSYVYAFRTKFGHLSTASPVSNNTGPILGPASSAITNFSITSNVVSLTMTNTCNFQVGQKFQISGMSSGSYLNNFTLTTVSTNYPTTPVVITASFSHANVGATGDTGVAIPAPVTLSGFGTSNPQCTDSATITNIAISSNILTVTCANDFVPGLSVGFSGLTNATFLNKLNLQILNATSTQFTALINRADYASASDTGTVTFNAVEIYRTSDGGGVFTFLDSVQNSGAGSAWGFDDYHPDTDLVTALVAPLGHLNDPPPGQPGSLVAQGGTIVAWWRKRLWLAVGNKLYFNAGGDCLNGIPEEAWPPGNVFSFAGPITGLAPTTQGLIVYVSDAMKVVLGGPDTRSFYPDDLTQNFGISSPNDLVLDGDMFWVQTTQGQLVKVDARGLDDTRGDFVADIIQGFLPTSSYLTLHRNGLDYGLFMSDGSTNVLRHSMRLGSWSTIYKPVGGIGALRSIETSPGVYTLMAARNTAGGFLLGRNLNVFQDDGANYTNCFVTIGNVVLSQPGEPLVPVHHILGYFDAVGSIPTVSILANEINTTAGPGFIPLPIVVNEPPIGAAPSQTLMAKRWLVKSMNQTGTSMLMHHVQMKFAFPQENFANTIKTIAIKFDPS